MLGASCLPPATSGLPLLDCDKLDSETKAAALGPSLDPLNLRLRSAFAAGADC